jgi:hypothetical protein
MEVADAIRTNLNSKTKQHTMKKRFTLIALFFICFLNGVNAQETGIKNIVGLWTSESTSTRLVFFLDKTGKLQLVQWDSHTGEEMEIENIETNADTVSTTEKFRSTNFETHNSYYLVSDDSIRNIIKGDGIITIYFRRMK